MDHSSWLGARKEGRKRKDSKAKMWSHQHGNSFAERLRKSYRSVMKINDTLSFEHLSGNVVAFSSQMIGFERSFISAN